MSRLAKMMFMRGGSNGNNGGNGNGNGNGNGGQYNNSGNREYNAYAGGMTYDNYGGNMEMRRRDTRGRFLPRNEYGGYDEYSEGRGDMQRGGGRMEMRYDDRQDWPRWPDDRRIGFESNSMRPYYDMHGGKHQEQGHDEYKRGESRGEMHYMPFNREMADRWTEGMKNADGSHGAHWTREQVWQAMQQRGMESFDPDMVYAVINSIYSDYSAVAKKHNVNNIDFYADMARAWIEDDDAVENKATAYFNCVVKK